MANNSVAFNGSAGYARNVALSAGLQSLTAFTYEFWLYRIGGGENNYGMVFRQEGSDPTVRFENDNGDVGQGLVFTTNWSTQAGRWSVAYPTNTTWTHYSISMTDITSTATNPVICKDGVSATVTERNAPSGTFTVNDADIYLGNDPTQVVTWNGRIGCFRLWNVVRTPTEILANKDLYLDPAQESGLIANWNMDEATGTTVDDDATGNNDLTLAGAATPTWAAGPTLTAKVYSSTIPHIFGDEGMIVGAV